MSICLLASSIGHDEPTNLSRSPFDGRVDGSLWGRDEFCYPLKGRARHNRIEFLRYGLEIVVHPPYAVDQRINRVAAFVAEGILDTLSSIGRGFSHSLV